ncbi:hypothetical protein CEP52_011132 [Fusarium oligoseptatum]|uniref:Rhodopsin domain-containing protein n=1 Tax=Fusarium oligoseptatum TaxID=2604345 RepID=A0A428T4T9_9HYPO|nr:hypothetical protein CEP52_011132 [Fusarium oligoseptatum]
MAALRAFNIEAFTLLALALLITALRTYVRISTVGWRNLWADDYLILLAAVVYSVETGLAYSVGNIAKGMANNSMTDAQRAALQPDDTEYQLRSPGGRRTRSSCGFSRGQCAPFYYRLTKDLEGYRTRILVGFALIIVTFVVVQLNLILSCHPFYRWWQIYPDPGVYCHPAISPNLVWTYLSFNVATDLYLIMIPMPMLWKAAMPWFQKVWLIALFSCGLFVTMAAILRVVLLVSDPVNGAQLAGSWAVRETFVAVLVTNLPMLFPQLKKWAIPIVARVSSSLSASRNPSSSRAESRFSNITSLDSWRRKSRRSSRPISINPPRNNESEVTIIDEVNHPETELQPTISEEDTHTITKEDPAPRIQLHIEVSVLEETETNNRRASTRSGNYAVSWSDSPPKTEKP